jgi:hypothetical protein
MKLDQKLANASIDEKNWYAHKIYWIFKIKYGIMGIKSVYIYIFYCWCVLIQLMYLHRKKKLLTI